MCTQSNTCFLGHTLRYIPKDILISSAVFAQLTAQSPYTLQWALPYSLKIAASHRGFGHGNQFWD